MANVGKFITVGGFGGSLFSCFPRYVLISLSIKFIGCEFFSKHFLMLLTSSWNKQQLLQILKAWWIKVLTRPTLSDNGVKLK